MIIDEFIDLGLFNFTVEELRSVLEMTGAT